MWLGAGRSSFLATRLVASCHRPPAAVCQNDKRDYIVNMRSLDDRQALADDFQAMFNAVPDDLQVRPHRRIAALPCDLGALRLRIPSGLAHGAALRLAGGRRHEGRAAQARRRCSYVSSMRRRNALRYKSQHQ